MLSKRGYTALEDPFEREEVQGVWLNNGEYALVLLQPRKVNRSKSVVGN